jgi:GntR family transcriptional regulator, transcriptional repressor for pyruvate dehydrogenase complex
VLYQTGLTNFLEEAMQNWNALSRKIATHIEDMIVASDDPRLPSQRELSSRFKVSRTTVREALLLLEASGKLRTSPGRRSLWVASPPMAAQGEPSPDEESNGELPSKKTYPKSEISRFRYLIEGQSARLAAMRITDAEIQQLEENLKVFKAQTRAMDLEASARTDFEFHQLIVGFSGVRLFRDLHFYFRDVIMQAVQMYRSQYSRAWEPVAEHEKIVEALRRRDPDEAFYYTRSHIVRSADRLGIADAREIL